MEKFKNEIGLSQSLLQLSKQQCIDEGDLEKSYALITEAITEALEVARASLWFYNEDRSAIICAELFDTIKNEHSAGLELRRNDFLSYFEFLASERILSAGDARENPATRDFTASYLKPLNIYSLLDAPIRIQGKMTGVICCEQLGHVRQWTVLEETFMGNIADILARAIGANERMIAKKELENLNQNLEQLVAERTMELEEQRARSLFSSKMALLGEMAGGIAHEINNPLAIIIGTSRQMKRMEETGDLPPEKLKELLNDIEITSLRIEKIVKGLRFFARDSQKDPMVDCTLSQILDDTMALCLEKMKSLNCEVTINVIPETLKIICQPVSLSQAFLNLISNSIDAITDLNKKWIRIECTEDAHTIKIRFTDSGQGIPQSVKDKIMLPFFTTKPIGKGTGLGLSIVRGIIEQHQGSILLDDSAPNTSFVIELPKKLKI